MCAHVCRESGVVGSINPFRILRAIDVEYRFSENFGSRDFQHRLKCSIDQNKLSHRYVLHDDGNWNIFNDGIEELLCLIELLFSMQMRGDVLMNRNGSAIRH